MVTPAAAQQLRRARAARAGDLAVRRRQPVGNLGPQAGHQHRRPGFGDPDQRAGHAHLRNCCRTPRGRCTAWRWYAASTPRTTDHGRGAYQMQTGAGNPAEVVPAPRLRSPPGCSAPRRNPCRYIHITPRGEGVNARTPRPGRATPRWRSTTATRPPTCSAADLTESVDQHGPPCRRASTSVSSRAARTADTEAYMNSFDPGRAADGPPPHLRTQPGEPGVRDAYGNHDFGRHCLLARRLLENGVTFVKVTHSNYDTPPREFRLPHRALGEFRPAVRDADRGLHQRGLLARRWCGDVRVRRTPTINRTWPRPLVAGVSVALGGCGVGRARLWVRRTPTAPRSPTGRSRWDLFTRTSAPGARLGRGATYHNGRRSRWRIRGRRRFRRFGLIEILSQSAPVYVRAGLRET